MTMRGGDGTLDRSSGSDFRQVLRRAYWNTNGEVSHKLPLRLTPGDILDAPRLMVRRRRGEPLVVFSVVLLLWLAFRIASWQPLQFVHEFADRWEGVIPARLLAGRHAFEANQSQDQTNGEPLLGASETSRGLYPRLARMTGGSMSADGALGETADQPYGGQAWLGPSWNAAIARELSRDSVKPPRVGAVFGHQVMLMAGLGMVPQTPEVVRLIKDWQARDKLSVPPVNGVGDYASHIAALAAPSEAFRLAAEKNASARPGRQLFPDVKRFSLDSWLFLRSGTPAPSPITAAAPSYGRSQLGAVARYNLSQRPGPHRFNSFLRFTRTVDGPSQTDLAIGLSGKPLPAIPVVANVEARLSNAGGATRLRPAAFVHSALPPQKLGSGVSVESYAQAGYIAGKDATAFADGQLRATGRVAGNEDLQLDAGIGGWGGVQKGAGRLDIGPTAALRFKLGQSPARIAVDYRFRVAGDAEPGNGVGVTLATGF